MSSTTPSTLTTSTTAAATTTTACTNLYEIPLSAPGCAASFNDAHKAAMASCCKAAPVIAYFADCGLFCAAAGQTVLDLQDCLFKQTGVAYQDVFCNAANNASATGAETGTEGIPATASASVVVSAGAGESASSTGGEAEPSESGSAAPRGVPGVGGSKVGAMIGGLLVSAVVLGAFQI
ncbi:hypothetical protein GGS24DRAFT_130446 [Hypoxylon argillaceum]|nr:hypothetical protein GGS24DRAFT_130446 [Hypoxylon argillaceum]